MSSSEQDIYSQALKAGDKYIKYPDQIARDLFALCDVDNNGEISVSDLLRLLVLAGIDADEDDARAMMQMGGEGKESVRYGEFRRIFYQGILGQNEKEYMAGLSVAVPRAGHEVNKDRLRIRKCLMRMVWSNDINFSRMVQWLGGLNNKSIKVFQSKEETAEILQIRPDNADLECFLELFDPTSFGIHDFRTLLTAMMATTEAEVKVKAQFAFRTWRQRKTGKMTFIELELLMRATYISIDPEEIASKAKRVIDALPADRLGIMELEDFMEVCEKFPAIVFPYEFLEKLTAEQVRNANTKRAAPPPPVTTGIVSQPGTNPHGS